MVKTRQLVDSIGALFDQQENNKIQLKFIAMSLTGSRKSAPFILKIVIIYQEALAYHI